MSRLQNISTDTEGVAGNVRLVFIADVRSNRGQSRPAGSFGGPLHTYPRPLTVAEVLPPTLRSGSYPGDENPVTPWPLQLKAAHSPKMYRGAHGQPASVFMQPTPSYPPGRVYAEERYDAFGAETPLPRATSGLARPEAARNLGSDLYHAQNWTPYGLPAGSGAGVSSPAFLKANPPIHATSPSSPHWSSALGPEPFSAATMLPGDPLGPSPSSIANHSTTTWLPGPAPAAQSSFAVQPPAALTSTLVSRMEALRAQLLKVSSTLSGVQERAAQLSSTMGHRSHTLLQQQPAAGTAGMGAYSGPAAAPVTPGWQTQPQPQHEQPPYPAYQPAYPVQQPSSLYQPQQHHHHQQQQQYSGPQGYKTAAANLRTVSAPGGAAFDGGALAGFPYSAGGAGSADPPTGSEGGVGAAHRSPGSRVYVVSVSHAAEESAAPATAAPPLSAYGSYPTPSHLSMTLTATTAPSTSPPAAAVPPPYSEHVGVSSGGVSGAGFVADRTGGSPYPSSPLPEQQPQVAPFVNSSGAQPQQLSPSSSAASSTMAAMAAAAAAAAAAVAAGSALSSPAAAAAAAGPNGASVGTGGARGSHHPFELSSPASRTEHVSLPQQPTNDIIVLQQPTDNGHNRHHADPQSEPVVGPVKVSSEGVVKAPGAAPATSPAGAADEEDAPAASPSAGSSSTLPRPLPGSAAPVAAAAAAAAPSGVVAPSTYASAFVRQLGSPVLQELRGPQQQQQQQQQQQRGGHPSQADGGSGPTPAPYTSPPSVSTEPDLPYSGRSTWGGVSSVSSLDAERVHPWSGGGASVSGGGANVSGGGVGGSTLLTSMFTPPASTTPGWRRSGGAFDDISGGGRSSYDTMSIASSLDAARVHPWSGGGAAAVTSTSDADAAAALSYHLQAADGSLELMAAVPSPSAARNGGGSPSGAGADGSEYDTRDDVIGGGDGSSTARVSVGGGLSSGSWLLLSPTVVVREPCAPAAVSGSGTAAAAAPRAHDVIEEDGGEGGEEEEMEQVAADAEEVQQLRHPSLPQLSPRRGAPDSAAAEAPADANADADAASNGSGSTTPTPRADLSFAFHNASFAMRGSAHGGARDSGSALQVDGDGDEADPEGEEDEEEGQGESEGPGAGQPCDAKEWPVRKLVLSDDAPGAARGGSADGSAAYDEEIMQTPTDASWRPYYHRYGRSDAPSNGGDVSDVDSVRSQGSAGPDGVLVDGRRKGARSAGATGAGDAATAADGGAEYYDGYSEEEGEDGTSLRESIGAGSLGEVAGALAARRRQEEGRKARQQQQQQQQQQHRHQADSAGAAAPRSVSSTAGSGGRGGKRSAEDAAAGDSFSFPSADDRSAAAAAAAAAALRSVVLANAVSNGGGGGSARSSTSGCGLGSPRVSGTFDAGYDPSPSSTSLHSIRLARPSRIVVPSSPRSSLGGWSQPSPVPSPYTYGVVGVRTPSSGGAANFSLRRHLDLTVSSCLFGDSDEEEEEHERGDGEEVEGPRVGETAAAAAGQGAGLRTRGGQGDVESGDEAESRLRD